MYDTKHLKEISKLGCERASEVWRNKRKVNIENYNASPKLCKKCNSPIDYDNRRNDFCSRSCSSSYNNLGKRRHGIPPKKCIECGIVIPRTKRDVCKKCLIAYNIKYKTPTYKTVKKYLMQTRPHKCARCELTEWLNQPIPLEAHHKDGNKYNNEDQNLELVCPNCHVFTDTYKVKNIKKKNKSGV